MDVQRRGQRSEVRGQRARSDTICATHARSCGQSGDCESDSSGSHVQELLSGGGEHRSEGGGELPALVGQVVAVTVGEFANQAMIAQKAKVPTDASGELLVGTAGTAGCTAKRFAQAGVGDARSQRSEDRGRRSAIWRETDSTAGQTDL